MNLPPTTYVKTSSRPSVPPQKFTPTFKAVSNNPPRYKTSSEAPPTAPEPPKRKQAEVSQLPSQGSSYKANERLRILQFPRKRATPKPAFGRFVPPTGASMKELFDDYIYNLLKYK